MSSSTLAAPIGPRRRAADLESVCGRPGSCDAVGHDPADGREVVDREIKERTCRTMRRESHPRRRSPYEAPSTVPARWPM